MKKVNKTKYAILGELLEKPQSGYEIKQSILESTNNFWQESDASIYPMLKKLEAEKLVTSHSEFVGKRERQIFEITPAGKKDFSAWLALPAAGEARRIELLLKIFFGANAAKEVTLKQLLRYKEKIEKIERQIKNVEENVLSKISDKNPHKMFWVMALQNGILRVKAEAQWIAQCLKTLKNSKKQ
jgi:DNA-binding PadR family transcriptional regulator